MDGFNRHGWFFGRQMSAGGGERVQEGEGQCGLLDKNADNSERRGERGIVKGEKQRRVFPELGKYSLCYSNCSPNTCKGARGDAGEQRTRPRETFRLRSRRSGN